MNKAKKIRKKRDQEIKMKRRMKQALAVESGDLNSLLLALR